MAILSKLVHLDNEYDYTIFVRAICSYLQLRDEKLNIYFSGVPTHHNTVLPDLLGHACPSRYHLGYSIKVHRIIGHTLQICSFRECVFVYRAKV